MSDYQRFISYIYEYDRGMKNQNVGFAKVESRGGICRFILNMKGAYKGNNKEHKVYLFYRELKKMKGIYMGEFLITNGQGEFRDEMDMENIRGSGKRLLELGGIYICSENSSEVIYASGWDDHVIRVEEFVVEPFEEGSIHSEEEIQAAEIETQTVDSAYWDVIEERIQASSKAEGVSERREYTQEAEMAAKEEASVSLADPVEEMESEEISAESYPSFSQTEESLFLEEQQTKEQEWTQGGISESGIISDGDKQEKERESSYEREKQKAPTGQEDFWERAYQQLPKVRAFEEEDIICLKIDLTDLEKLPRSNWVLGNNSFLLHGFYNFRYLILAKMDNIVMIGIPGMYHRKEQLMAAMFGFGRFRPSQPCEGDLTGRFGYWYREVQR